MIIKILDCSTAHVTNRDMDFLSTEKNFLSLNYPEGVHFHITEETPGYYSMSFYALIAYARDRGCERITLDCDGEIIDHHDLAVNSW